MKDHPSSSQSTAHCTVNKPLRGPGPWPVMLAPRPFSKKEGKEVSVWLLLLRFSHNLPSEMLFSPLCHEETEAQRD